MNNQTKPDSAAPGGDVEKRAPTDEQIGRVFMATGIPKKIIAGEDIEPKDWFDFGRACVAALSAPKQVGAGDTREVIHCPACDAPCKATVHGRGGDWGWGTTDEERTTYKYEGYTTAQPAPQPVEAEGLEPVAFAEMVESEWRFNPLCSASKQAITRMQNGVHLFLAPPPEQPAIDLERHRYPTPYREGYSDDGGDTWLESPDDAAFVNGLAVGDTYELQVCHYSVSRTYRVTKAPDEDSDDYEVEPVALIDGAKAGRAKGEEG